MHTGPVGRFPRYLSEDGGDLNHSIQARKGDTFAWATVVTPDPLSIVFDGQTSPVPGTPSTLVPETALLPYTRVWVQRHSADDGHTAARQNIVLGLAGGGNPWTECELQDGFQPRANNNVYMPQVKLDGSGLVDFQGQMDPTGLGNMSADVHILTVPDGYVPRAEVRWVGFPVSTPSNIIGGWIGRAGGPTSGELWLKWDSTNPSMPLAEQWCIIIQPWEPQPAQPY